MGIFDRKDPVKSLQKYLEKLEEYQEAEANLLVEIATLYYENNNSEDAVHYLEKASYLYHELDYPAQEASIWDLIGDVAKDLDDEEKSIESYQQAYKIFNSINDPAQDDVLKKLEEMDARLDDSDIEVEEQTPKVYSEEVETKFSPARRTRTNEEIDNRLDDIIKLLDDSAVYDSYKSFSKPLAQVKEAYEMSSSIGDEKGQASLLVIMGIIYLKENNTSSAQETFIKSLKMYQRINDLRGEAISFLLLGSTCYVRGDEDRTSDYLNKAMIILKDTNDIETENVANNLFKALYVD
jgi:tetratricopeptide (TPR) repeat protein